MIYSINTNCCLFIFLLIGSNFPIKIVTFSQTYIGFTEQTKGQVRAENTFMKLCCVLGIILCIVG